MNRKAKQPAAARFLLSFFLNHSHPDSVLGDIDEMYLDMLKTKGVVFARAWYWLQILLTLPSFIRNSIYGSFMMFNNYFKTTLRNMKKHKSFTVINISGLAVGLACCILLALFINSELSFDTYHKKSDRIFRVGNLMSFNNFSGRQANSNGVIAAALKDKYPEVEDAARFRYWYTSVKYKDKQFNDRLYHADNSVFNIFTWPFLKGDPQTALERPYSIVLTEESALKYFGTENPIGKTLILNNDMEFTVTGVIADIPDYSTIRFKGLCSMSTLYAGPKPLPQTLTIWSSHTFFTYVLLKEGIDHTEFETKIKDIYHDYAAEALKANGSDFDVFLQPLRDVYLKPLKGDFGPITYVYIFSAVAVFILLIACVNFMNLSTARSMTRASEVGLRKVFGAGRPKLIRQFLTEALLMSMLAMIIAAGAVYTFLPAAGEITGRDLFKDIFDIPWLLPGLLGAVVFTGLLAGSYPAFFLSRFEPAEVIKNKLKTPKAGSNFRRALVMVQFVISITLIIGTALIIEQLNYLKSKDTGFNKEHVVCMNVRDPQMRKMLPVLHERLKKIPDVISASSASSIPGWGAPMNSKIPEGYGKENTQLMLEINADENYLQTMGIELLQGRNFSKKMGDSRSSVIINETAAKKYGWENPVGKIIQSLDTNRPKSGEYADRTVIGVVKDYDISGVLREVKPAFIGNDLEFPFSYCEIRMLAVRINPDDVPAALGRLESLWKDVFPDKPFQYFFLDDDFDEQFYRIERSRDILSYFTFLAVFIACLGLFGMVSFSAERRTKEIGIRKTLGSSVMQIVGLLSKELVLLVLAANIIAYPAAYFAVQNWLSGFPNRIEISVSTFILSTLLAVGISFLTIAYQAVKAGSANPAQALKYE